MTDYIARAGGTEILLMGCRDEPHAVDIAVAAMQHEGHDEEVIEAMTLVVATPGDAASILEVGREAAVGGAARVIARRLPANEA